MAYLGAVLLKYIDLPEHSFVSTLTLDYVNGHGVQAPLGLYSWQLQGSLYSIHLNIL